MTSSAQASFSQLALIEPLLRAVKDSGYTVPTPIQLQAIPALLQGRDLLGCAKTGTGKTAAFALPILQRLAAKHERPTPRRPRTLVVAPTRELAAQVAESFRVYGAHLKLSVAVVFGGVGQGAQVKALARGVEVLVATPGRLLDLKQQGHVQLDRVEILVLDEADQMLDMGFIPDVRRILAALPKHRQTLLFSATMPPVIAKLADGILHDPVKIAITPPASTVELVEQSVYFVGRNAKPVLLAKLLAKPEVERALVFTRTKRGADRVAKRLAQDGIPAQAIHGNKSQGQRERTLEAFKIGHARTLVATDIAARGIDIDGITHVINYEIPNVPETYVHRIGRTGRAGASGTAISLCDDTERAYVLDIERLIRRSIPVAGHATAGHGRAADVVRKPVHRPASAPQHPARPHSAPSRSHGSSHPRGGHAPKQGGGRRHPAPHHGTPVVRERPTSHSHSKPQSHSHSSTNFGAGL